ncbi:MAG: site-2 protease family protein [Candidatus Rokubacteria bacterium]|nr:site-2 protease family protein [Candidatus Rokubacteria bacterium]
MSDPSAFLAGLAVKIPALLLAVTLHEVAHGLVADRLGDPTARALGRLTLNPLPHIDPLGALALVLAGFGWAKPVPVNGANLRHPRRDMALVAAAGPVANLAVAFAGLVTLGLVQRTLILGSVTATLHQVLLYVFTFNLGLAVFNLLPLPPLDGGHFLPYLLPRAAWPALPALQRAGPVILIVLLVTGAVRWIIGPVYVWLVTVYMTAVQALLF